MKRHRIFYLRKILACSRRDQCVSRGRLQKILRAPEIHHRPMGRERGCVRRSAFKKRIETKSRPLPGIPIQIHRITAMKTALVCLWITWTLHLSFSSLPHYHYGETLPSLSRPANSSRIFYGIMFDAGSTGTRIHIYTFIHKHGGRANEPPLLDNETFQSMKPGLSAHADVPEIAGHTVRQLLHIAKKTVPPVEWKRTPVVFRATAGLRLLPEAKAKALLDEVQEVLEDSPFMVLPDSVSVMNGTSEGLCCTELSCSF
ncbi:hypothetical protein DNTS_009831 [Danionella cerebrum]|uniref:nucleoside diphosphate phosphatase n=1 Tax=Danionella cerebrum TaxID=2873325 RepID=A0A553MXP0_9TELE|nr:hypothetical protein DNTS_009831 [Danionella translucida]